MTAEGYPETPLPGRRLYCPFCGTKLYDEVDPYPWVGPDARPPEGCEHTVFVYAWGDGIDEDSFFLVRPDYADSLLSAIESSEEYLQNAEAYARDPNDAREPLDATTREAFTQGRFEGWDAVALRTPASWARAHTRGSPRPCLRTRSSSSMATTPAEPSSPSRRAGEVSQ